MKYFFPIWLCLLTLSCGQREISPTQAFPHLPWITTLAKLSPMPGGLGIKASDCGTCHTAHYQEWRYSTHAWALDDLQLQAELTKENSPPWLCLNCHIPLANQREKLVYALLEGDILKPLEVVNPHFEPELKKEAITCAVCHLRPNEKGETVVIGPGTKGSAPHPVKVDREFLVNLCENCHTVNHSFNDTLMCFFETGHELRQGPYAGKKRCVDCHMPQIRRSLVKKGALKVAHRHSWPGGGVPKRFFLYSQVLASGYRPAVQVIPGTPKVKRQAAGDYEITLPVTLTNVAAAHKAPTGDPERHYLLEAFVPLANFRSKAAQQKIGQTWQWWPKAQRLADNRLAPQESRTFYLVFPAPIATPTIQLSLYHVRLTEENAVYMRQAASLVPLEIQGQIAEIEKHYPFRSEIYRGLYRPKQGWSVIPLSQLMQQNAQVNQATKLKDKT